MGIFYCKCLICKHIGTVKSTAPEHKGCFVCSKCGSKDVISVYRNLVGDTIPVIDQYDNLWRSGIIQRGGMDTFDGDNFSYNYHRDADDYYDDDAYERREQEIFEEERQLDAQMMAPTGWEDDQDLQEYMGISE